MTAVEIRMELAGSREPIGVRNSPSDSRKPRRHADLHRDLGDLKSIRWGRYAALGNLRISLSAVQLGPSGPTTRWGRRAVGAPAALAVIYHAAVESHEASEGGGRQASAYPFRGKRLACRP